jgi:hypothetical protein
VNYYIKLITLTIAVILAFCLPWLDCNALATQPKAKFYDFNEQLIDGERRKPSLLYTNSRDQVKFDRLLNLKKSFLSKLFKTAKEKVFK